MTYPTGLPPFPEIPSERGHVVVNGIRCRRRSLELYLGTLWNREVADTAHEHGHLENAFVLDAEWHLDTVHYAVTERDRHLAELAAAIPRGDTWTVCQLASSVSTNHHYAMHHLLQAHDAAARVKWCRWWRQHVDPLGKPWGDIPELEGPPERGPDDDDLQPAGVV